MSYVHVLYIGDSYEEDMNDLAEHFFAYWDEVPENEELVYDDVKVKAGDIRTVGDAKRIKQGVKCHLFYAVVDHGTPFWNMMRCIPYGLLEAIFDKVLDCFEDSQGVKVLAIHV